MKKILNFIKSPQFFGLSCLCIGAIMFGCIIDFDRFPLWLLIIYVIVGWTAITTGHYILNLLDFNNKMDDIYKKIKEKGEQNGDKTS